MVNMKEKRIRVQRYLYEGRYWTAEELVEAYGADNGVNVETFKRRVKNTERWTIETALSTSPRNHGPERSLTRDRVDVIFPRFVEGVYWHMQPLLDTVYSADRVRIQGAKCNRPSSEKKDEYIIITLENGKKLLAYRGEYSVVSPCSD